MWKALLETLDAGDVHTEQMLPPSKGNLLTCKAQLLQEKSSVRLTNVELLSWEVRMPDGNLGHHCIVLKKWDQLESFETSG